MACVTGILFGLGIPALGVFFGKSYEKTLSGRLASYIPGGIVILVLLTCLVVDTLVVLNQLA